MFALRYQLRLPDKLRSHIVPWFQRLFANQPFVRSSKPNATTSPEKCATRYPSKYLTPSQLKNANWYQTRSAKRCHTSTPEKSAPMATAMVIIKNKFFLSL